MYICHAEIRNFRALKKVEMPIKRFSVLIGENDVGKSSFLYALDRFFDGKKISSKEDFFCEDTAKDITITLTFDGLPSDENLEGILHQDGKVIVRKVFSFDSTPKVEAIMENGSTKTINSQVLKNLFSSDSFHFIPVRRDLSVQFSMNKNALLGKTFRAKMRQAIEERDSEGSLSMVKNLLKDSLEDPRTELESFLKQQMQNEEIQLVFDELMVDPVEGVSFRVKLSDDKVKNILIENRGAGTQNNLIIALFRLVASLQVGMKFIFAMEEPENSLHPRAQRQLLSVLQDISNESQVIVTTHSPVFLERSKFENNIILTRTMKGNTVARTFNPSLLDELRIDLGIRPSDALLKGGGNCAILVEGNTEEDGFPIFMEMLGLSDFKLGIAIINLRGSDASTIRNTARLLLAYNIPCVIVLDKDAQKTAIDMERESKAGLKNIRRVFCLKEGSIEDYYPLEIVAEVINRELRPKKKISVTDFDASKHGLARLADFSKVMYEKGAGTPSGYLKRLIGSTGTKIMKAKGLAVPNEIKEIFEEIVKIVNENT
jgi:predicted ATP-dependent endonuclease of OLD family